MLPTDSPRKGQLAGEIIQSLQSNLKAQAKPPLSLHRYCRHLYTCWTVFQRNLLHCLTSPTSICFLNGCAFYLREKEPFFFCLHLNSLQHKMNDYNVSFSLSLLSNTEPALNLQSVDLKPTTVKLIWNLCLWGCNFTEEKHLVQQHQLLRSQPLPNAQTLGCQMHLKG